MNGPTRENNCLLWKVCTSIIFFHRTTSTIFQTFWGRKIFANQEKQFWRAWFGFVNNHDTLTEPKLIHKQIGKFEKIMLVVPWKEIIEVQTFHSKQLFSLIWIKKNPFWCLKSLISENSTSDAVCDIVKPEGSNCHDSGLHVGLSMGSHQNHLLNAPSYISRLFELRPKMMIVPSSLVTFVDTKLSPKDNLLLLAKKVRERKMFLTKDSL